jgi:hypothetical protein
MRGEVPGMLPCYPGTVSWDNLHPHLGHFFRTVAPGRRAIMSLVGRPTAAYPMNNSWVAVSPAFSRTNSVSG